MCAKLAVEFKDEVKIVKIDTEKYVKLASEWDIKGLPTLILFHKGKVLDRVEGLPSEEQLKDRLRYFLSQAKQ